MSRSANAALLMELGVSADTIYPIPSNELQLIADAVLLGRNSLMNAAAAFKQPTPVVKPLRKGASLDTAMKAFGINRKVNAKGDTLVAYHPNRPKYPFVYLSPNGHTRWKQTIEQAQRRFR
jgi:hypothetical protein